MTDRTRRNDDDMELDDERSGRGQGDTQGRSTSSQRTDEDDDRESNRGGDASRRSTGHTNPPQKKK